MKIGNAVKILVLSGLICFLGYSIFLINWTGDHNGHRTFVFWGINLQSNWLDQAKCDVDTMGLYSISTLLRKINSFRGEKPLIFSLTVFEGNGFADIETFDRDDRSSSPKAKFFFTRRNGYFQIVGCRINPAFWKVYFAREDWEEFDYTAECARRAEALRQKFYEARTTQVDEGQVKMTVFTSSEAMSIVNYYSIVMILRYYYLGLLGNYSFENERIKKELEWEEMVYANAQQAVLIAFSDYYFDYLPSGLLWRVVKDKVFTLLAVVLIIFFVFHLFRRGLFSLIREESSAVGFEISRRQFWMIVWRFKRYLLLPSKEWHARGFISAAVSELKEEAEIRQIEVVARSVWGELRKAGASVELLNTLRPNYQIVLGRKVKSARSREVHLRILYRELDKLKRGLPTRRNIDLATPVFKQKREAGDNRKEELRQSLQEFLSSDSCLDFGQLSFNELLKLETCFHSLPDPLRAKFLARNDFALLGNYRFMEAVRTGSWRIAGSILGESVEPIPVESPPEKPIPMVLSGREVVLVGGRTTQGKADILREAVMSLGAKSCDFINCNTTRRVEALAQKETALAVVFMNSVSHKAYSLIRAGRAECVLVNTTNANALKKELIQIFQSSS